MPKQTKVCRVCGKTYDACGSARTGRVNWREVACSPSCGVRYFEMVGGSRVSNAAQKATDGDSAAADATHVDPDTEDEPTVDI